MTDAGLRGAGDDATAEALVALCENEFGAINALVNCTGTAEPPGSSIRTVSRREFDDLLDVHLGTVFAAGNGLTLALAAELAEHGVCANVVCPGVKTRLSSGPDFETHIDSRYTPR